MNPLFWKTFKKCSFKTHKSYIHTFICIYSMLQSCLMNIIGLKTYWVRYNIILITFGQKNMASFWHYGMGLVWPRNTSMLIGMRHCSIRWALIGFVKACSIAWTSVPQGPPSVRCKHLSPNVCPWPNALMEQGWAAYDWKYTHLQPFNP